MLLYNCTIKRRSLLLGLTALAGCGFTPILGEGGFSSLQGKFQLPDAADDETFAFRRVLARHFGEAKMPLYTLELKYASESTNLAVVQNSVVTRKRISATGQFTATRIADGLVILDMPFQRVASYSVNSDRFAAEQARKATETNLAETLAEDFAIRLVAAIQKSNTSL